MSMLSISTISLPEAQFPRRLDAQFHQTFTTFHSDDEQKSIKNELIEHVLRRSDRLRRSPIEGKGIGYIAAFSESQEKTVINSSVFSQIAIGKKFDSKIMDKIALRVNQLAMAIKTNDATVLTPYLSPDFSLYNHPPTISINKILPQMLEQCPKGRFLISNLRAAVSGGYDIILVIPGVISLDIAMDKEFRFQSIEEATKPESFYDIAESFHANRLSFPFEIVSEHYPMIKGSVNGKSGYFMFDTGTPNGFLLNNNFLNLSKTASIGNGEFDSGQQFELFNDDTLSSIKIASEFTLHNPKNINTANFEFIEKFLVPEFLGFIGYDAFKQYNIEIDYQKKKINLYRLNDQGKPILSYAPRMSAVGILKFQTSDQPQIPKVLFSINGKSLLATFDTGALTCLVLTKDTQDRLKKAGLLKKTKSLKATNGSERWQLNGLLHEGKKYNIPNAILETGDSDKLKLGASFLSQFISSWNYKTKMITLYPANK